MIQDKENSSYGCDGDEQDGLLFEHLFASPYVRGRYVRLGYRSYGGHRHSPLPARVRSTFPALSSRCLLPQYSDLNGVRCSEPRLLRSRFLSTSANVPVALSKRPASSSYPPICPPHPTPPSSPTESLRSYPRSPSPFPHPSAQRNLTAHLSPSPHPLRSSSPPHQRASYSHARPSANQPPCSYIRQSGTRSRKAATSWDTAPPGRLVSGTGVAVLEA